MADLTDLLAEISADLPEELVQTLLTAPGLRIERIVLRGHRSADDFWYDQPEHEWVLLLAGAARIQFAGEEPFALTPGQSVHIPAHRRHRVEWTDPAQATIWLAVHYEAN